MGFDLHSIKNKSTWKTDMSDEEYQEWYEKSYSNGEYFRSNVWMWKYIHLAVMSVGEIRKDNHEHWYSNSGYEVSESYSKRIAEKIRNQILNDKCFPKWITHMKKTFGELKMLDDDYDIDDNKDDIKDFVEEFVIFCKKSGGFTIC